MAATLLQRRLGAPLLLLLGLLAPRSAGAFVLLRYAFDPCPFPCQPLNVDRSLREAAVWDAAVASGGLADGIQVAVPPGFGEAFAAGTPLSAADFEQGVRDAFAAWETPELSFDITFDAPYGSEIELLAVDSQLDPLFQGRTAVALALTYDSQRPTRTLTSGIAGPGRVITGSEIHFSFDRLREAFNFWKLTGYADESDRLDHFTHLMIHEIGHALGLSHPDGSPDFNLDDDGDPFTVFHPDPLAPWEGLALSPIIDVDAIMSDAFPVDFTRIFATRLAPDDRSGLNFLYPSLVPEPGVVGLLGLALAGGAALRRRARRLDA